MTGTVHGAHSCGLAPNDPSPTPVVVLFDSVLHSKVCKFPATQTEPPGVGVESHIQRSDPPASPCWLDRVRFHGEGALPSPWAVTDFAAASFVAAGAAVGELLEAAGNEPSQVEVDRVLSSGWFHIFPMPPSRALPGFEAGKGAIPDAPTPWMVAARDGGR